MRNNKGLLIAAAAIVLIGLVIASVTLLFGNDFRCSDSEQDAMSEFPHFADIEPRWESNAKITGGCTTTYTVDAEPAEVLAYYQEGLRQRGWALQDAPPNSFPTFFFAERGGLRFDFQFAGVNLPQFGNLSPEDATALRDKIRTAEQGKQDPNALKAGQTRVSISGGHTN